MLRKKIKYISPRTMHLPKGKYKILNIDYNEIDNYIAKKFSAVGDLWDSMDIDIKNIIMKDFADEGIIEMKDALKVAKLSWKEMPVEFKLLIIALEFGIDLKPNN
jgi:hypothetical protein